MYDSVCKINYKIYLWTLTPVRLFFLVLFVFVYLFRFIYLLGGMGEQKLRIKCNQKLQFLLWPLVSLFIS